MWSSTPSSFENVRRDNRANVRQAIRYGIGENSLRKSRAPQAQRKDKIPVALRHHRSGQRLIDAFPAIAKPPRSTCVKPVPPPNDY